MNYTSDMDEVSGRGGDYERMCRAGIQSGALWVALHPGDEPAVRGSSGPEGYVSADNEAGRSLITAINETAFTTEAGQELKLVDLLTPHQYFLIFQHVGLIASMGWRRYAEHMRSSAEGQRESELHS